MYLSRGPQGKLRNGLRKSLTGNFPHHARYSHGHGSVRPLDDFNTDFAIGLDVQDARHEYLTKGIRLEGLEIGFEFWHGHFELLSTSRSILHLYRLQLVTGSMRVDTRCAPDDAFRLRKRSTIPQSNSGDPPVTIATFVPSGPMPKS
jgi:hypothetical protein